MRLRKRLKALEQSGKTKLYSSLTEIIDTGLDTWMPRLSPKNDSHTGLPHFRNVEGHLNHLVSDHLIDTFTATEIFTLLTAIYLHDFGKQDNSKIAINQHAQVSCCRIQRDWPQLKIPTQELALWVSVLTCSHCWEAPTTPGDCDLRDRKCSVLCNPELKMTLLDFHPDAQDGPVRLEWLATLLRLSDEVDNKSERAVPNWVKQNIGEDKNYPHSDSWRRFISSVYFDRVGKCIRLRTLKKESLKNWPAKYRESVADALTAINNVLFHWKRPLKEMGLDYHQAFIEVVKAEPIFYGVNELKGNNLDKLGSSCIEPSLSNAVLEKVVKAMERLDRGVIDESSFSYDVLALEAGVNDVDLVKLCAKRINRDQDKWNIEVLTSINQWQIVRQQDYEKWQEKWSNHCRCLNNGRGNCKRKRSQTHRNYIKTGIDQLDILLCPEDPNNEIDDLGLGLYAPIVNADNSISNWLSPIAVVEGESGDGKTTLSLQIAANLVRSGWLCLYYSLEQEPEQVSKMLDGYTQFTTGNPKEKELNLYGMNVARGAWYDLAQSDLENGALLLPKLTPSSSNINEADKSFNIRYSQIEKSIAWAKDQKSDLKVFFFVDSLSAFNNHILTRSQLNQLFGLFRSNEIPLVLTLERQTHWPVQMEEVHYYSAKNIADVVIKLSSFEKEGYFRSNLQIIKTKYNRHILGKHAFKIKSPGHKPTSEFDDRYGIVVYPSLHYHLSHSRGKSSSETEKLLIPSDDFPIGNAGPEKINYIHSDSFVVISGLHGGHKFALAMNILLCRKPKKGKVKLIVSFAEEREIQLNSVALQKDIRKSWGDKLNRLYNKGMGRSEDQKIWELVFGVEDEEKNCIPYVKLLNFRLGQILPEEFLYIFNRYMKTNEGSIDAVLFSDTAQLNTRFPFLSKERLFLPSVVDILKSSGIFTIFVDVMEQRNYNQALMAAADCRIFVELKGDRTLARLNNVRGKVYSREPRRLQTVVTENDENELIISRQNKNDKR